MRRQQGVLDTRVGYAGGDTTDPSYANHPGHAEAVQIVYDPSQTDFTHLLDFFFRVHDPTTLNRQGNDVGSSYRSTIFYASEQERLQAQEMIDLVNASGRWPSPVVTTLQPLTSFYPAQEEHQDYLVKNPDGYTCHFLRGGSYLT